METIKNYLESMFSNLPNTPEVKKAKEELWQMMEDKYNELIEEGLSDNAAVGTVISEFGNLDELAGELGIHNVVEISESEDRKEITLETAKEYLAAAKKKAFQIALGVAFCIMSIIPVMVFDALGFNDDIGGVLMFPIVAVGVILFIYSSVMMKKWEYLKKEACSMDFATTEYVKEEEAHFVRKYALQLAIGVALCVISVVPASLLDEINFYKGRIDLDDLGGALMFILVAGGVFLIVYAANIKGSFETLFKAKARRMKVTEEHGELTDRNEDGYSEGNIYTYSEAEKNDKYISPDAKLVMEVYWPTITCIYLSWSFLTFDWYITWVIWPIAAVLHEVLNSILTKRTV